MTFDLDKAEQACSCLKALAHPIRLGILCALQHQERSVQELEQILGTSQSNMSQHLAVMKLKNILKARKEGNQVFYAVRDDRLFELIELLKTLFCPDA
jgi:ArsR family transcriptional regulator